MPYTEALTKEQAIAIRQLGVSPWVRIDGGIAYLDTAVGELMFRCSYDFLCQDEGSGLGLSVRRDSTRA